MKLIIDSNVLISALIKDSTTRKILTKFGLIFYYPEISLGEIEKYKSLILEKSNLTEEEYKHLYRGIINNLELVPTNEFNDNLRKAKLLIGHVDEDDVVFIALALSIENDGIWSDDAHFKRQNTIKVFKTEDVVKIMEK